MDEVYLYQIEDMVATKIGLLFNLFLDSNMNILAKIRSLRKIWNLPIPISKTQTGLSVSDKTWSRHQTTLRLRLASPELGS
jgi:hypothetical protein